MRINGIRCDHCGKEHYLDAPPHAIFFDTYVPDDWYQVYRGKSILAKESQVFCSQACIHQYFDVHTQDEVYCAQCRREHEVPECH